MAALPEVVLFELCDVAGQVKDGFYVFSGELLTNVEQACSELVRRAKACVAQGDEVVRLAYSDDEEDLCTLTSETLKDSLTFIDKEVETGVGKLKVVVITTACKAVTKQHSEEVHESRNQGRASEERAGEPQDVEVHVNIICDGCDTAPIYGPGYKSLVYDDFDLCERCFKREDREADEWRRIRSSNRMSLDGSFSEPPADNRPLAVHANVVCDRCKMCPVIGVRFMSLDWHNYDLCQACWEAFKKEPGQADHRFKQVGVVQEDVAKSDTEHEVHIDVELPDNQVDCVSDDPATPNGPVDVGEVGEESSQHGSSEAEPIPHTTYSAEEVASALGRFTLAQMQAVLKMMATHDNAVVRAAIADATMAVSREGSRSEESDETETHGGPGVEAVSTATVSASSQHSVPDEPQHALELKAGPQIAHVVTSLPLVLGVEAEEVIGAQGDVPQDSFACGLPATQVHRLGSVAVQTGGTISVPASAAAVVKNIGEALWPDTTMLKFVSGDDLGLPAMDLGPIAPGDAAEIILDLSIPPRATSASVSSFWALVDASGQTFGPLLQFDVCWK